MSCSPLIRLAGHLYRHHYGFPRAGDGDARLCHGQGEVDA